VLQDGDIMNVDITAFKDGFHGDSNATFLIGDVTENVAQLVERTKEALDRAIAVVMPGQCNW
jgi:methionyl aminopeptidase